MGANWGEMGSGVRGSKFEDVTTAEKVGLEIVLCMGRGLMSSVMSTIRASVQ